METPFNINEIEEIEMDGIDMRDYPDFCDAYIVSASWKKTGESLTEEELNKLNDDSETVHQLAYQSIYN